MHNKTHFDLAEIKAALASLEPQKCKLEIAFDEVYPIIRDRLDHGVTKKAVLEELARLGLKLHPVKFKALYDKAASHHKNHSIPAPHTSAGGRK